MNCTEPRIVETYSSLLKGVSSAAKLELIQRLSKSFKRKAKTKDSKFYKPV